MLFVGRNDAKYVFVILVDQLTEFVEKAGEKTGDNAAFGVVEARSVITFALLLRKVNVDEYDPLLELREERLYAEVFIVFHALTVGQFTILEHFRRNGADHRVHTLLFLQNEVVDLVFHQAFEQGDIEAEFLVVFREYGRRQLFVVAN